MGSHRSRPRGKGGNHGLRHSAASGHLPGISGSPGVYVNGDVRTGTLTEWRTLGELGQLLCGLSAGYSIDEVAVMRGWTPQQARKLKREAIAWGEAKRGLHTT